MAGVTRTGGQRAYICAVPGTVRGCGMSVVAEPVEEIVRDAVLERWGDEAVRAAIAAADTARDEHRAKLRALLGNLDADMAETEANLNRVPYEMTQRREQLKGNLRSMEARWAAAQRELDELGTAPAAAAEPALAEVPAPAEWDKGQAAHKVAAIRRLHLRFTIGPATRRQGASRLPFDAARVQVTDT
jgi:hypothetical protein